MKTDDKFPIRTVAAVVVIVTVGMACAATIATAPLSTTSIAHADMGTVTDGGMDGAVMDDAGLWLLSYIGTSTAIWTPSYNALPLYTSRPKQYRCNVGHTWTASSPRVEIVEIDSVIVETVTVCPYCYAAWLQTFEAHEVP